MEAKKLSEESLASCKGEENKTPAFSSLIFLDLIIIADEVKK